MLQRVRLAAAGAAAGAAVMTAAAVERDKATGTAVKHSGTCTALDTMLPYMLLIVCIRKVYLHVSTYVTLTLIPP